MENSPFNKSSRTVRTPPPTPTAEPVASSRPKATSRENEVLEVISTSEIQTWMTSLEKCLNEVCSIVAEGKMNSEQKLRVNTLCRKIGHGASQMAVQYQSLKMKAVRAQDTINTLQDKLDLSDQLQDLKLSVEKSSKPLTGPSFADMVKSGARNYIQPLNISSVAIYPGDKSKSSEETKAIVQKIVRPEQMNLHVRGVRKTRNGGIIISTDTKDDIERLKHQVQTMNTDLTIDEPYKHKPRLVIIGVPTTMSDTKVFTCLYNQNIAGKLQDCDLETFLRNIKLSHKSGRKNAETCNFVLEMSAVIRKALIVKDRVFINWSSCPVRDFTLVTRCYKCQQYGHAAKTCRETSYICSHCGDEGHTIKECMKKQEEPKCATCLRFKKPSNHSTGTPDCPAKLMAEKRYINSIDYECR